MRLSVFAGGWTLEAAEQVCADPAGGWLAGDEIVDLLGGLVDKSLVVITTSTPGDQPRYRMLETIRQYAHERMVGNLLAGDSELAAVRQRHLDYFLGLAQQASRTSAAKASRCGWIGWMRSWTISAWRWNGPGRTTSKKVCK